ncbi:hypothetical protein D3C86_1674480 [compost metagenome]
MKHRRIRKALPDQLGADNLAAAVLQQAAVSLRRHKYLGKCCRGQRINNPAKDNKYGAEPYYAYEIRCLGNGRLLV